MDSRLCSSNAFYENNVHQADKWKRTNWLRMRERENEEQRTGRDLCSMGCSVAVNWPVLFGIFVCNPRYSLNLSLRFRQPLSHGSTLVSAYRMDLPRPQVSALPLIRESDHI